MEKISATREAIDVIALLKNENGELVFNISGGCCDGTSAMCYKKGDFIVPLRNIKLGEIDGCEVFIDHEQNKYFSSSNIIIDVKKESAFGNSFSLEIDLGYLFIVNSVFVDKT